MAELHSRIEAHALANAVRYDGKANPNNVLPKIIGEFPELKADIKALRTQIEDVVARVNALALEDQRARLEQIGADLLEKKPAKEKDLPPLPNATPGKVITRFPPEPSKYPHLGHAISAIINQVYADRYEGKIVLRLEDANPEKVTQEFVDMMVSELTEYLGVRPAAVHFVSDDMERLNAYAAQLVGQGDAYMCFCDRETMGRLREEMRECPCRAKPTEEHVRLWEEFLQGAYAKGEAVLRYAGDMASQNTVLRDPVLYRAVPVAHYRHGMAYKVWPTYDFYSPIEEVLCGVTHILRSNEFELRVALQEQIKRKLGLPGQEVLQYGRISISGATTQGREIREGIESGQFIGWDDPRLVTLAALKRRGIRREAYYALVRKLGLSPYPVSLDFSMLAAENRRLIEPVALRFSFVRDPQELVIDGVEPHEVELNLHPETRKGGRRLHSAGRYLIAAADAARIAGKRVRLMGDLTFEERGGKGIFLTAEMGKVKHDLVINWLPAADTVPVEIMMPDASVAAGRAERTIAMLQVDEVVQFERFGFCRLDAVENGVYRFWYAHD